MTTADSSADEELALAASSSLSIGPSDVIRCDTAFAFPKKEHGDLYSTTLGDCQMMTACVAERKPGHLQQGDNNGAPGFPDFPSCWVGEEGGERIRKERQRKHQRPSAGGSSRVKQRRGKRITRKAVNAPFGSSVGRELKRALKDQRRAKRAEMLQKLHQKRRRKRDMVEIRRGLSSLKCT